MHTVEFKDTLKEEMKSIIESISSENIEKQKESLDRYFTFLTELSEFEEFRKSITYNYTVHNETDSDVNRIIEKDDNSENEELTNTHTNETNNADPLIKDGRKMYRFERRIKAGCLPEINAYVPESFIRKMNLENNCYLYAEEIGDGETRHFKYEVAKDSEDPTCPGRVQINFCLVEKQDSILMVRKSFETGEDIRFNDTPYSIPIKNNEIVDFGIKENDLVDIAFPEGRPQEAKVIWVRRENLEEINNIFPEQNKSTQTKSKNNQKTTDSLTHIESEQLTSLANKTVLIIGNEPDKAIYKKAIEERGGSFLWADAKENLTRLKAKVRKSDMVIFLLYVSGHVGMEKIKAFCKEYNIPFLTTFNLGKSSIIRMAEEQNLDNAIGQ